MLEQQFLIGVKGLVQNTEGKVLLVELAPKGDLPARWDLPGGKVHKGETFLETLKRELQEELGVTFDRVPEQFITIQTNVKIALEDAALALVIYRVALSEDASPTIDPLSSEQKIEWFTPTEAANMLAEKYTSVFSDLLRKL
jgi:8-oxo-dGTP diphosphatase